MRYALDCYRPESPHILSRYEVDTDDYSLYQDKARVDLSAFAERYRIEPFHVPPATPFGVGAPIQGKSKNVLKLRIQIGLACNYNCTYCLQANLRKEAIKAPTQCDIDHLFESLAAKSIQVDPMGYVDIWGGEPLVYWESVKYTIEKIRKEWSNDITLTLFTNGVLLNDAIVTFLLDNNIHIVISHDGQGQRLRSPIDPMQDKDMLNRWKGYFHLSIEKANPILFYSVITPANCDLVALRQYFEERLGERIQVGFGGVASESETLPASCVFTNGDAARLRASVFHVMTTEPEFWPGLHRRVSNLMTRFIQNVPSAGIRSHCNSVEANVLNIDAFGNVLSCHNRPAKTHNIGSIKDFESVSNDKFTHWSMRPHCAKCLVLGACKGACPDLSEVGFNRCCRNEFAFHSAVFYSAWWFLTGTLIRSVTPKEVNDAL